jgi:hypothetical protein
MRYCWEQLRPGDLVITPGVRGRLVIAVNANEHRVKITWMFLWGRTRHHSAVYTIEYVRHIQMGIDCDCVVRST